MAIISKIFKKAAAVTVALAMLTGGAMSASAADTGDILNDAEWNAFVEEKLEQDSPPGLSLALVSGSDVSYKSWGFADAEKQTPVTEDTVFEIGSCSKAFTALTIFLLQEEGKLSVDDSVSDYIPWWNVTWQGAAQDTKIWQLIGHCSGIPNSTMLKIPSGTDDSLFEETVRIAENIKLTYEPGTAFEYCNLGYDILAYITETVSGMPFEEYAAQEILQPIGMNNSGYGISEAQGYRWFFGSMKAYNAPFFRGCYGDGQLCSTAHDMSLWLQAQLGNMELPEKLTNAIAASHKKHDEYKVSMYDDVKYISGWIDFDEYRFHQGSNPNFSSYILVDESRNIGIFAFANAWVNTSDYAVNSLYEVINGEPIDRQRLDVTDVLSAVDTFAICLTLLSLAIAVIVLISTFTQKKRLAKKPHTYAQEKKKFIIRSAVLIPLFALVMFIPQILVIALGYGSASYEAINTWLPYSFLISIAAFASAIILMFISSVLRFMRAKK